MKKVLLVLAAAALVVLGVVAIRTALFTSRQVQAEPAPPLALDERAAIERFAGALRYRTISYDDPARVEDAEFEGLRDHLAGAYPRAHAALRREGVGEHSLLFTWEGTDPSLRPILLMGHLDVVPVEPGTEEAWAHPPFEGRVADGYVWGRGAIDNKINVVAILEAVEHLVGEGFRPERTVYLAFGHDEEVGGNRGAAAMAALLGSRGVELEFALDEGGTVLEDSGMLEAPVALVGIAEKGYVSLALTARDEGGHSSMPPRETAAGRVSRAVVALQENPFAGALRGPTREMFAHVGPEMPLVQRALFANTWLFGPLIERRLAAQPSTDAMLRTTTAPTMLEGSVKDNVLPSRARAVVNFRIFPGETVETVRERVREVIADERVEIETHDDFSVDPSPVSPTDGSGFELLQRSIREVFPDAVVTPYLVVGATDSRHYRSLTENVYRFAPTRFPNADLKGFHGTNERLRTGAYLDAIRFYRQILRGAAGELPPP